MESKKKINKQKNQQKESSFFKSKKNQVERKKVSKKIDGIFSREIELPRKIGGTENHSNQTASTLTKFKTQSKIALLEPDN